MTKTTAELASNVLEQLALIAPGEAPSAEDAATVTTYYSGVFAEESVNDLFYWEETVIPDEAFEALTDLIAGRLAGRFGMQRPDLEASGTLRLRRLSSRGSTGLVVTGSYF